MRRPSTSPQARQAAKRLRREMTEPERRLWQALRAHRFEGIQFRRQVPMGPYVADFACHGARLVIEVDGWTHGASCEIAHDARRDAWFAGRGYNVVRIGNHEVMNNLDGVLETMRSHLLHRLPPSPTLPRKGGGSGLAVETVS